MEEPDVNKAIKERFQGGWRASLLSLLRKSANTDVMEIMQETDGLAAEDENEIENRCIFAALPFLFLEKRKGAPEIAAQSFWLRAKTEDPDEELEKLVESTTSPRLISTGAIAVVDELCLASEGMVVCRFRPPNILLAVATLLGSFYSFNMQFPKGSGGSEKNIFLFIEHILLGQNSATLPLSVEHVLTDLLKVKA